MPRWLKGLILILVVAGAGLLSLPWWLGAALRPALRARGISFERYERAGYAHFRLRGMRYANANFEATAGQVESLTPLGWFWQRLRGAQPTLMVTDWRLRRIAAPGAPAAQPPGGLLVLRSTLQPLGPRLAYWLPRAHLLAGEVQGFGPELKIASADWRDARLRVDGLHLADHVFDFVLAPAADGSVDLLAHTTGNAAKLHLVWSGAEIKGEAMLWDQPAQLSARFPDQGWLPV
ncbi:MAG: hypothetical protein PSW75_12480, partial [bacterium]|nr:hypothetical protein [bacterium]